MAVRGYPPTSEMAHKPRPAPVTALELNPHPDALNRDPGSACQGSFEAWRLETQAGAKGWRIKPDHQFLMALGGRRDMGGKLAGQGGLNQVAELDCRFRTSHKILQTGRRAVKQVTDQTWFVHCDQVRIEKQVGR